MNKPMLYCFPLCLLLTLAVSCTREATQPSTTQPAEAPLSSSAWIPHPCALHSASCLIPMQFPQDYTPLRPCPLYFFFPGTAPQEVQSRLALLVDATPSPAVADGWPQYAAAEAILEHAATTLNTLPERRILTIPPTKDGLLFACRHASFFTGLIIRCTANTPLDLFKAEAPLLANLARLPVFIDSSAIPVPPDIVQPLIQMLQQSGVSQIDAPEFTFVGTAGPAQLLQRATDFIVGNTAEQPWRDFTWHARELKHSQAFWLKMTAIRSYGQTAAVQGRVLNDGLNGGVLRLAVSTRNLDSIAVCRDYPGLRKDAPLAITIDGQPLLLPKASGTPPQPQWNCFLRDNATGKWRVVQGQAELSGCKSAQCEGPIGDFLREPFVIVTAGSDDTQAAAWKDTANAFASRFNERYGYLPPVLMDQEFAPEKVQGMPLLLFGGPEDNALTAALLENDASLLQQLFHNLSPEQRDSDMLGCMTLRPGGIVAPDQMILIVLGNSPKTLPLLLRPLEEPDKLDNCDVMLYDTAKGQALYRGFLDSNWAP